MAKISGLTIKLSGDTTELDKAIKDTQKKAKQLNNDLRDLNSALKIDPNNNILYSQKENLLKQSIENAEEQLKSLREAHGKAVKDFKDGKIGQRELETLTREIEKTEIKLKGFKSQLKKTGEDASELARISGELKNIDKAIDETKKRVSALDEALKLDPRNLDVITQRQNAYSEAVDQTRTKIALLKEGQQAARDNIERNGTGQKEYQKFTAELVKAESQLKKLLEASNETARKLKETGEDFKKLGEGFSAFGDKMIRNVTVPIAGAGAAVIKAGTDLQSAMTGVRKTTDMTDGQLYQMEKRFRGLAQTMPIAATEFANIAELGGQLGIDLDNLDTFSKTMAMMATATNMTSEQSAENFARIANITGMAQDKMENLGSAVVYLGNNYATSESEISDMMLRLAAQTSLMGMTEGQALGLATAMSSVGLNAEAGGSAMTRILQRMNETGRGLSQLEGNLDDIFAGTSYNTQDLVDLFYMTPADANEGFAAMSKETGLSVKHLKALGSQFVDFNYKLNEFGKVSGVSGEEFSKIFNQDPTKAIVMFLKGLKKINDAGGDVSATLQKMGINGIREKDTIQRLTQAADLAEQAMIDGNQAFDENIALSKEAELRYKDTASQMQIFKNNINELAIQLSEKLMPIFNDFLGRANDFVRGLGEINSGTLDQIIKVSATAAAIGPVSKIVGTILKTLGGASVIVGGAVGSMSAAIGTAGSLGGALKNVAGLIFTPKVGILAGIAAIGFVAYKTYQEMKGKAFKSDLFDGISEGTTKAVGEFVRLEEEAGEQLKLLWWSADTVSKETADAISGNFSSMTDMIVEALNKGQQEAVEAAKGMYGVLEGVTDEELNKATEIVKGQYEKQKEEVRLANERIKEILQTAANEKRALTEAEQQEIGSIRQSMKEQGVMLLAEEKSEAEEILRRYKEQSKVLAAEQAADVVKKAAEQRDQTVQNALDEYDQRMAYAKMLREEGSAESVALADKIEFEASRQKAEAIKHAEEMHREVINHAKQQAGEHVNEVDWETGEVKTKWQVFFDGLERDFNNFSNDWETGWINMLNSIADGVDRWTGTIGGYLKQSGAEAIGVVKNDINDFKGAFAEIPNWWSRNWYYFKRDHLDPVLQWFNDLGPNIRNAIGDLWQRIRQPFDEAAKNMKNAFNFTMQMPTFPKLDINMKNKKSIAFGTMPEPNIKWYKKGAIFTKPTLFNTPYGMKGVGEAGAEAVLPISQLASLISSALKENQENKITGGIYVSGNEFIIREEADIEKISYKLFKLIERRNRGVGNV